MDFLEKLDYLMSKESLNKNSLSKACGIPYTTIDGWYKKGYEGLKLTTLRKLADFFDTPLDYWVKDNPFLESKNHLSSDETDIIKKYRLLDDRGKAAVQETVNREYSYVEQKTVNLSDVKKGGRTQTVRIASRNGPSTLTLNEEQLKAARELLKKIEENPDPDIDDDLI